MGDYRNPAVVESWHAAQASHHARGVPLEVLVSLVEHTAPARVLDAGVGSGLVAERILDLLPGSSLVGVDFSPVMLGMARERLARFEGRVELIEGDLAEPDGIGLGPGTFDLAVSVQTLHNVHPEGQCRALAWIRRMLVPDGVAFLLDKVAIPEPLYPWYRQLMDLPPEYAEYAEAEASTEEWSPDLETYLGWLRDAKLQPAVLDLQANYALVGARPRPG